MLNVLLSAVVTVFSVFVCGTAYRLRGSRLWNQWTGRGVGTARLFVWGGSCGLATAAHGLLYSFPWWLPFAVWIGAFAGSTLPQFGSIDIGRDQGSRIGDTLLQSLRGVLSLSPVAAAFWFVDLAWWPLVLAGALAGVLYAVAWARNPVTSHTELNEPAEFAELWFGGIVGAAITWAFAFSHLFR